MMFSKEEHKQYNRQLILNEVGIEGQLKLKNAKVLVIGAGGLGCPIIQYLTAAGIGRIGIIDDDVVDQSNLHRQVLYTHEDIGASKAETAVKRLSKLNPFVSFQVFNERLTKENAIEYFHKFDIIVDGSDNFPTRYLANDASVITKKPLVFGSIFKFEGQVTVFNMENGPSYRCLFPNPPGVNEVPNCSEIGVLGVLPGIIGALQANEVIKLICGFGEVLSGRLLMFDALSLTQNIITFQRSINAGISELAEDYEMFCGVIMQDSIVLSELNDTLDKYNLLDVRTDLEREEYNIGGFHIPLPELPNRLDEVPTEKPLVVYCKAGVRSEMAISLLKDHGFIGELINLEGGLYFSS
ncbi:MAG: molybdopterin-synthase adenylyltransferase MoeB [Crocinitomicaceae bacterium]|nr:molybdopterin-synthase adenylyltransferase MoeB [Crocinitomicaceae bacterium]